MIVIYDDVYIMCVFIHAATETGQPCSCSKLKSPTYDVCVFCICGSFPFIILCIEKIHNIKVTAIEQMVLISFSEALLV